nr:hypothetical protein [Bacilli bacterium]
MNKILFWIKNILSVLVLTLIVLYSFKVIFNNIIFISLYVIFLIVTLKDIIKKDKINNDKLYNIISILVLFIISFVYLRVFMDSGFIHNSSYYMDIMNITNIYTDNHMISTYIDQNMLWFNISLVLLLLYRFMNYTRVKKEYLSTSIVLMIISIISIIPSIYTLTLVDIASRYLDASFSASYLFITLILVGIEVFRFIQGKYKNKMYMFWVSLGFHLFGIITCAIQMHYTFKYWL